MEAITEVYESGWSGHDLLYVQAQNLEMLWQDFSHKLGDQVLIPLNTYTNQFPETRVRPTILCGERTHILAKSKGAENLLAVSNT